MRRYIRVGDQLFFSATEIDAILQQLSSGVISGTGEAYSLSRAGNVFKMIEQLTLQEDGAIETES